ncbi:MAG: hypothetical protein CO189_10240 [candidate division Zixibacteria bacterium CG_4_9_14_3_um_filter_46_8]|nr:MAG: hypothetical protein CO189_10240 [candidate division Zixibacteria bacterium CG_4_9_14_3_um_filter_46_8]
MLKLSVIIFVLVFPATLLGYTIGDEDWTYMPNPMGEYIYINPNCSDLAAGNPGDQINAIWMAAKAWNDYGKANFEFSYGGPTARASVSMDDHNIIFFSPHALGSAIVATYAWVISGNVTECDMVFYDELWLFNAYQRAESYEFDVWSLAAREFGHFLVLGGSQFDEATMYPYYRGGEMFKRTLHWDDIAGIQAIYGQQTPFSVIIEPAADPSYARVFNQSGGSFDFIVRAYNNSQSDAYFRATLDLILPSGYLLGPLLQSDSVFLGAGDSIIYNSTQIVPAGVPLGEYRYRARMRETISPYSDFDDSYFMFWVIGSQVGSIGNEEDWVLTKKDFSSDGSEVNLGFENLAPNDAYRLQNFPNPFNSSTIISFDLDEPRGISLEIYNISGQKVRSLFVNEQLAFGPQSVIWDGTNSEGMLVAGGIYFYKLTVREKVFIRKMIFLK